MTDILQSMWQKKGLEIVCGTVIIAVLIATLWPFNFSSPNKVIWLTEGNGVRIDRDGVLLSKGPLGAAGSEARRPCSLEVVLRAPNTMSMRTIFGFYTPNNPREFVVRQWNHGLVISNDSVDANDKVKTARAQVGGAFEEGRLLFLTVASGLNGTVVYTNGRAHVFSSFSISQSDLAGQLVIGNSAVDYEPWTGEVHGLVVYSKELAPAEALRHFKHWSEEGGGRVPADLDGVIAQYGFAEGAGREIHNALVSGPNLEIPERFTIPHKAFLKSPMKEFEANWSYTNDILRNIAGFVPVGFLVCAYWGRMRSRWRAILFTVLAGAGLSFGIEVLQFYIPQRGSGITDIITNTLGAALGALLARPAIVLAIFGKMDSNRTKLSNSGLPASIVAQRIAIKPQPII